MEDINYRYTEEDVEIALRFLRLHFPKYATPENAIKILSYCREKARDIDNISSEDVKEYLMISDNY